MSLLQHHVYRRLLGVATKVWKVERSLAFRRFHLKPKFLCAKLFVKIWLAAKRTDKMASGENVHGLTQHYLCTTKLGFCCWFRAIVGFWLEFESRLNQGKMGKKINGITERLLNAEVGGGRVLNASDKVIYNIMELSMRYYYFFGLWLLFPTSYNHSLENFASPKRNIRSMGRHISPWLISPNLQGMSPCDHDSCGKNKY